MTHYLQACAQQKSAAEGYLQQYTQKAYSLQKSLKEFELDKIETTAKELIEIGNSFIQQEVQGGGIPLIPIPIALQMIETLSEEALQYCDKLRLTLAKATRIFAELVLLQSFAQGRKIYFDTKESMLEQLEKVQSTLPETEVATQFEVECSLAAVKALEAGDVYFGCISKKDGRALLKGAAMAMILASPTRLLRPVLNTLENLYDQLGDAWHSHILTLRWEFTNLTGLDQFKQLENRIGSLKAIQGQGEYFSLCVTEIFIDIISNKEVTDTQLKQRVFEGEGNDKPGLLQLADLRASDDKNKFWKTRYRVIEHLDCLAEKDDFCLKSYGKLMDMLWHERHEQASQLLAKVCRNQIEKHQDSERLLKALDLFDMKHTAYLEELKKTQEAVQQALEENEIENEGAQKLIEDLQKVFSIPEPTNQSGPAVRIDPEKVKEMLSETGQKKQGLQRQALNLQKEQKDLAFIYEKLGELRLQK